MEEYSPVPLWNERGTSGEGRARVNEEELERMSAFRDFIESLDLDDFDKRSTS